jgi:glycerol kinase
MSTILAIDQGTTSTKAFRAGDDGQVIFVGRRLHRQIYRSIRSQVGSNTISSRSLTM